MKLTEQHKMQLKELNINYEKCKSLHELIEILDCNSVKYMDRKNDYEPTNKSRVYERLLDSIYDYNQ